MAEFNKYNLYSFVAGNMKIVCEDNVLADIKKLETLDEYYDVIDYMDEHFGEVKDNKIFEYPNDIKVIVNKKENYIMVAAIQNEKQIMGYEWKFTPDSSNK